MALSRKHQQFVNEYVTCWNATEAYRRVYPKASDATARVNGSDLLTNTDIAKEIDRRVAENTMTANEVLVRLASQARGTIEPFVSQLPGSENVNIDITTPQARENLHLVKRITQRRVVRTKGDDEEIDDTTVSIELHDPQAALTTLAKHHGLLIDKNDNRNFDVDLSKLSDDQLERIAKGEDVLKVILDGYQSASKSGGRVGTATAGTDSDADHRD